MPQTLILGASRGLGLGLAKELAGRGWVVTGTVRKSADRAALEAVGASSAIADITDEACIEALKRRVTPPLDLLLVNAGISEPEPFDTIDEPGIGALFLTNAVAPVRAALALLETLAPDATIAFMSSRMGSVALTAGDHKAVYRASKAALNTLTRAMLGRFGARPVLSLHPGWVATDMGGAGADLDVATSVKGLADVLEAQRGKPGSAFLDYSGKTLEW